MQDAKLIISERQSIRAFDASKPVSMETLNTILTLGARAPNGSNIQPWRVQVLMGGALIDFSNEIVRVFMSGAQETRDYAYYMNDWRDPWISRRRATGWGLYGQLGIARGEKAAMQAQQARNYKFFDAPVGLIISMDADMGQGAWLDMGAFIQTLLLASRTEGLEACPIAAFCNYPGSIRQLLDLPETETIVTGMAIGYPDINASVNRYRTPREPVTSFATFRGELTQVKQAAE